MHRPGGFPVLDMEHAMSSSLVLTRADLTRSIRHIFDQARAAQGGEGWPRLYYRDEFDVFEMRVTCSAGVGMAPQYDVSCFLNGRASRQLNGTRWPGDCAIGEPMLRACGAPASASVEEFFS